MFAGSLIDRGDTTATVDTSQLQRDATERDKRREVSHMTKAELETLDERSRKSSTDPMHDPW